MKRIFTIFSIVAASLLTISCTKGDGEADYGNQFVYIPQATASGGIDNIYNVPSGGGENTYNFSVAGDNVNVFLGVMVSGKAAVDAFTVNVESDDAAAKAKADELGAKVLPSSAFTLPSKVEVGQGKNGTTFNLSIQKSAIVSGEVFVSAVRISNPSKYQLSEKNTEVLVVIDCTSLLGLIK